MLKTKRELIVLRIWVARIQIYPTLSVLLSWLCTYSDSPRRHFVCLDSISTQSCKLRWRVPQRLPC